MYKTAHETEAILPQQLFEAGILNTCCGFAQLGCWNLHFIIAITVWWWAPCMREGRERMIRHIWLGMNDRGREQRASCSDLEFQANCHCQMRDWRENQALHQREEALYCTMLSQNWLGIPSSTISACNPSHSCFFKDLPVVWELARG